MRNAPCIFTAVYHRADLAAKRVACIATTPKISANGLKMVDPLPASIIAPQPRRF
jgi:hypothetical protein